TYQAGVRDLGTIDLTVDFSAEGAHKKLLQAYHSGESIEAFIGLGDGEGEPLFIDGDVVAQRSGFYQKGFIPVDGWEFDDESFISLTLSIQKQGHTTETIKTDMFYVLGTGVTDEVLGDGNA